MDCDIDPKRINNSRIIIALHERAVSDLKSAAAVLSLDEVADPRAISEAVSGIVHAQQIIAELALCINKDTDLGRDIARIYCYAQGRLETARAERNANPCSEIADILKDLCSSWKSCVDAVEQKGGSRDDMRDEAARPGDGAFVRRFFR